MLGLLESKGRAHLARLHAACMAVRLSPAGLGKSGGVLVTAGRLHVPRARRFGFFSPGPACMTCGTQPPRRGGGGILERVGEDSARDG
jgi:hypothetical protein